MVVDPEPKSKFEEIAIQAQFSGYTHSHSKGNIFQFHKHFFYLLFLIVGMQVIIKPECRDVGIQCSLHAITSVSTPKKQNLSHIVFSDSDISDIEADKHHHNQSYVPSSESCLSNTHFTSMLLLFHMFALFCKGPMKHTHTWSMNLHFFFYSPCV